MKFFQSMSLVVPLLLVVASIYGLQKGLALLVLYLGAKETVGAKEYYDKGQKKLAIASLIVGILVCVCGILSLTNII